MLFNRKDWRLIITEPSDAVENMALDEAIFHLHEKGFIKESTLRVYNWEKPCVTIGYFQKYPEEAFHGMQIVRRLTGGLAVRHEKDISYSIVTNKHDLKMVNDQQKTYHAIHSAIKKGLDYQQIETSFCDAEIADKRNSLCVKTVFQHDLKSAKGKVLGSSQRKRGATLLQQGSIHIDSLELVKTAFHIKKGFEDTLDINVNLSIITSEEEILKNQLMASKYSSASWNKKF